jgi:hypothetical protein
MREKNAKSTAVSGKKSSFFQDKFFVCLFCLVFPSKVHQERSDRRGQSIEQATRDTGDGERKGRGRKWMPLEVR